MAAAQAWAMPHFLLAASGFVMVIVAVGLIRILRGPTDADRMMAAQLFASGGVAALLLLAAGAGAPAALDVALTLALLTAFASVAFVKSASHGSDDFESREDK
jgi:multicomponent Na+:H+ antiporter subunit F